MTPSRATAEIFFTAFSSLSRQAQDQVLARFLSDRQLREDLIDLAIAEKRRLERARPFKKAVRDILKERSR